MQKKLSEEEMTRLLTLYGQGKLEKVVEEATVLSTDYPGMVFLPNLMGAANLGLGHYGEAEKHFAKTVELKNDFAEGYCNLGLAQQKQNKLNEAIRNYQRAIELKPDLAEAYNNMGHVFRIQKQPEKAVYWYNKALHYNPNLLEAFACKLHQQAHMCDWSSQEDFAHLADKVGIEGDTVDMFMMMSREDNPLRQLKRARHFANKRATRQTIALGPCPEVFPQKLNIGYFSSDLNNHPVMHLVAGVFEHHDRNKFTITAFYNGPAGKDKMRLRAENSVDEFIDVTALSEEELLRLVRQKDIHIAVDMNGYTGKMQCGAFARRLAPIQINYLGYPGTMGADFIDYIVGDEVLIPERYQEFYSEKIIYLPNCYQPNDDSRMIPTLNMTKADAGLPEESVVLCCFNNNYKINQEEFSIWMRILRQTEKTVLWLLDCHEGVRKNLKSEAEKQGVSSERIIFAKRVSPEQHLARHQLADLFIDTFFYNAHTTASDALWAGLPLITKAGAQFSARVAASILKAAGLEELVTDNNADYEKKILYYVTHPQELAALKQKVADRREHCALFDTALYTRDLEKAYHYAFEQYLKGIAPGSFKVSDLQ